MFIVEIIALLIKLVKFKIISLVRVLKLIYLKTDEVFIIYLSI